MVITSIALCTHPTPASLQKSIDEVLDTGAKSLLILASEKDQWTQRVIDPLLTQLTIPIFGGIFPSILLKKQHLSHGTLVVGFNLAPKLTIIEQLSGNEEDLHSQLHQYKSVLTSTPTLFTVFDGLTSNIEQLTEALYAHTGVTSSTIGCGAGFIDFIQRPCLFTNQGLIGDAAIIASLPTPHFCGYSHGWRVLDGPFLATQSIGNTLKTINYLPAYDSYKNHIKSHYKQPFEEKDFFTIAQTYPLGIAGIDKDLQIRSPIQSDGTSITCIGDIQENATIYLLNGDAKSLIESAQLAAKTACEKLSKASLKAPQNPTFALVIDCISKAIYLKERFDEEVNVINDTLTCCDHIFGVLSIGEVCNSKSGPIELLNKSTVVAIL